MVTASDITRGKPNPQPYLAGAAASVAKSRDLCFSSLSS